ncbi:hypothetical protein TRFO_27823 [Tritrichomonas foetus]|uniref:CWH43-like N-terminal domain-containing protein n=1 Tax=Tritrichomonas foetus TaxID=1144522 RepID=A0A1J4K0Y4_9EUKA|nr:hypothetical protein TRFO_27823 [Tritrichomonas foetus]|eukprot:OHT04618.1 hypothetical protein TRFO_27823 [Tritrichomonas foetus]
MEGIRRNFFFLYAISIIFPVLIVGVCWYFYYSMGHWKRKYLPTISVTVIDFPENRIFSVGMGIEFIILFSLFIIRNDILNCQFVGMEYTLKTRFKHYLFLITGTLSSLGLLVLSSVTLEDNFAMHNLAASAFFFGSFAHYCFSDSLFLECGVQVRWYSELVTYMIILFAFVYMIFLNQEGNTCKTIAAILQYACCIFIFTKVFLLYFDMPKHTFYTRVETRASQPSEGVEIPQAEVVNV